MQSQKGHRWQRIGEIHPRFRISQYCEYSYLTFESCDSKNHEQGGRNIVGRYVTSKATENNISAVSSGSKPHKGAGVVPGDGHAEASRKGCVRFFNCKQGFFFQKKMRFKGKTGCDTLGKVALVPFYPRICVLTHIMYR